MASSRSAGTSTKRRGVMLHKATFAVTASTCAQFAGTATMASTNVIKSGRRGKTHGSGKNSMQTAPASSITQTSRPMRVTSGGTGAKKVEERNQRNQCASVTMTTTTLGEIGQEIEFKEAAKTSGEERK